MWDLDYKESWAPKNWCFWTVVSWESLGLRGDPTSPSQRKSVLSVHWKDWCWSWNSNTLDTWCQELTHLKRSWCWERLMAGGEGDDRGWDGWMASPTQWTWVWVDSGSWWWTGRPGVLWFMGSQRVRHNWVIELNWSSTYYILGTGTLQCKYWDFILMNHKIKDFTPSFKTQAVWSIKPLYSPAQLWCPRQTKLKKSWYSSLKF